MQNMVWYACYGSNMLYERFMYYIEGGYCGLNGCTYTGCKDKTPPVISKPIIIPFKRYFAGESKYWDDMGVAFLDDQCIDAVLGRMYLITKEQFEDIKMQEGDLYTKTISLGFNGEQEILTFTNNHVLKETQPSKKYLDVIERGMKEMIFEE